MIDLNNTWCKASEKIYWALVRNGFKSNDNIDLDIHTRFNLSDKKIFPVHKDNKYATHGMEIEFKDDEFQYVELKPKNNFNDYGFEADFEGEILTELDCFYIGWIKTRDIRDNDIFKIGKFLKSNGHFCTSTENGELNIAKFNLKKIKREWYENPDNIGKLIIVDEKKNAIFVSHHKDTIECIDLKNKASLYTSTEQCRPATKEEVLALYISQEPGDV